VLNSLGRLENIPHDRISQIFDMMKTSNIEPTTIIFNTLLNLCAKKKDLKAMDEFFQKMNSLHLIPNTTTYTILMDGYSRHNFDSCWNIYEKMKSKNIRPSIFTFTTLLTAMGIYKRMDKIDELIEEMKQQRISYNPIFRNALRAAFTFCGNPELFDPTYAKLQKELAHVITAKDIVVARKKKRAEKLFKKPLILPETQKNN